MNRDHLEELATGYAAGSLEPGEAAAFSQAMKDDSHLQKMSDELHDLAAKLVTSTSLPTTMVPSARLKERIMHRIGLPAEQRKAETVLSALSGGQEVGIVVCNAQGEIEWANPAFSELCGYTLDEVRGHKPGMMLQGTETDTITVQRMRTALSEGRGFHEELLNYHKDGQSYRVAVTVSPIYDAKGRVCSFVGLEQLVPEEIKTKN
ncbi:MAG: PAS domain-containing protein [Chthoniobacteraceae bacterium]